MKIVGLEMEQGRITVSVIEKGLRKTELTDSFSFSFATDAELVEVLRARAREWTGARIVSSIPGSRFSQRTVLFPFSDRTRVEKALPFELEDSIPYSFEDIELDHLALDREEVAGEKKKQAPVLAMLVRKTVLRRHLELLLSAGVDPQVVVPSYVGLSGIAKLIPVEGIAVLIDGANICLKNGNAIKACRSFSDAQATAGIRHTLKALELEHGVRIEKVYLLSARNGLSEALADDGLTVERVTPDFHGKEVENPVSLGLALSQEINFRKGAFAYHLADAGARKRRNTLIIAGAIAALLAATNLGVKYYLVQSTYAKLDWEIKDIYHQMFPSAKAAADPVRQLRTSLDDARKKFGALGSASSALDAMKAVTDGIPKEVRVGFQDFLLEDDRLKLQGEAASFESVDKIKAELQKTPLFTDVIVQDTRMGVNNKVKFRLEIKVKQVK